MTENLDAMEFESLREQVRLLNERVTRLEQSAGLEPLTGSTPQPLLVTSSGDAIPQSAAFPDTASAVPVLGKSLLALAGAYLLRALTEMGTLPVPYGIGAGIAYATLWFGFAARTSPTHKLASLMYSLASVLVLTPLVWEATVRFHVFSSALAATILTLFTIMGLIISWQRNLTHIAWIATLAGVFTSAGLLLATSDVIPFTVALLAIAVAVEVSACLEHWLKERFVVAMAANFAVLLATFLVTRPNGVPESYIPFTAAQVIAAQASLLIIYLASAIVRTLWRGLPFTNVEVLQCVIAFLIGMGGSLRVAQGTTGETGLALFTLLCAAACYAVAFLFLEKRGTHGRNFYIYSTFGLLLTTGGAFALLSPPAIGIALPALALALVWTGERFRRTTLYWHGSLLLYAGALFSGALSASFYMLGSTTSGWQSITPALLGAALLAGACCFTVSRCRESHAANTVAIVALATLLLTGMIAAAINTPIPALYQPSVRTAVMLGAVLALARGTNKAHRWTAIALILATGAKILLQEFRASATMPLFLSIFLYGGALLILPRLFAANKKTELAA